MLVEISNMNKNFGGKKILKDFSLTIREGESIALCGNSGKGKSTLLNIIGLLEPFQSGMVVMDQSKVNNPYCNTANRLRRYYIGYLFQNFALIDNASVQYNLSIAQKYSKEKNKKDQLLRALDAVSLSRKCVKQKIYELSGGEQQRVALARLLVKPCKIVLADEPTGSLDGKNAKMIIDHLLSMKESGKSIVIATHDKQIADLCDRCIHL